MKAVKKIIKTISIVAVLVGGGVLFVLSRQVWGYRAFVVQSASMEPGIMTGSLVVTKYTSPYEFTHGDIVTFVRPDVPTEFVTHRISNISQLANGIPVFKTRGDNNATEDSWDVVSGAVVGKVIYSIPTLGYILSFARTKIGIAVLIILPALWIIVDEIINIIRAVRDRPKNSKEILVALVFGFLLTSIGVVGNTQALFLDEVLLSNNQFSVASIPNPPTTPTPTTTPMPNPPCGDGTSIAIVDNGAGSQNTVTVIENCYSSSSSANTTNVETNISVDSNSGGNVVSGNTGENTDIQTASGSASAVVTVSGN